MKTVIEVALSVVPEADREDAQGYELLRLTYLELERFAELVRADEREACAKLCEELDIEGWRDAGWDMGTIDCAAAIRARGENT